MAVGALVQVSETIAYTYPDPAKNYKLPKGCCGVVGALDGEGDAEVKWDGLGFKWLCRADFAKVSILEAAVPQLSIALTDERPSVGCAADSLGSIRQ